MHPLRHTLVTEGWRSWGRLKSLKLPKMGSVGPAGDWVIEREETMGLPFLVFWGDLNLLLDGGKQSFMGNDPKSTHQEGIPTGFS